MTSWIEPPPKQKGMGCVGKGCLSLFFFLLLLAVAFVVGGYVGVRYVVTSTEPRDIPQVQVTETTRQVVQAAEGEQAAPAEAPPPMTARARWDEFETAARNQQATRLELTADDLNQLIAGNRKLKGKAFISIENNIARVQVSIPLEKVGFRGRYLNGDFLVRPSPDRDPRNLQVTPNSMSGVDIPERFLKFLLGTRSLRSYVEEYSNEYHISALAIEENKVIIETNGGTLAPAAD